MKPEEKTLRVGLPWLAGSYTLGVYASFTLPEVSNTIIFSGFFLTAFVLGVILIKAFKDKKNPSFVLVIPLMCILFIMLGVGVASVTVRSQGQPARPEISMRVVRSFDKYLPKREAGLMAGILIGDTANIPTGVKDDFKKTGLAHILAVSGMNVSMLASAVIFVVSILPVGAFLRFCITLLSLFSYMSIAGLAPSVLRAGIMFVAALGASLLSRKADLLSALSLAVIATLLYDPTFLFNIGWQLSFAATLFIVLFTPLLKESFALFPRVVSETMAMTLGAQLGVLPILACRFHQLSLVTVAANLLVVQAIFPLMIIGVLIAIADRMLPAISYVLSGFAHMLLAFIIRMADILAAVPFASVYIGSPPAFMVVVYYVSMIMFCLYLKKKNKKISLASMVLIGLLFTAVLMGCQVVRETTPSGLRVVFMDVGQGDAALIQTQDGGNVLIDGGPFPNSASDVLDKYGVKKLDLVIISHAHADHISGLKSVLENRQVDMIVDAGVPHTSRLYIDLLRTIEEQKIKYRRARTGMKIDVGQELRIDIVWPPDSKSRQGEDLLNNESIVALIKYQNVNLLFPGDIQADGQRSLLKTGQSVKAQILKVPHHGSRNAAEKDFIEAVQPEVSVISVGADNKFGHPAGSTLKKLENAGSRVYRTDRNGSIILSSDGKTFEVETEREE